MYSAIVQVLKVNEVRKGVGRQSGNPYELQDCECVLLDDALQVIEVGVLMVPKDLTGKLVPGTYTCGFTLRAGKGKDDGRRIGAQIVSLTPLPPLKVPAK